MKTRIEMSCIKNPTRYIELTKKDDQNFIELIVNYIGENESIYQEVVLKLNADDLKQAIDKL
jgi:hypothetical protein